MKRALSSILALANLLLLAILPVLTWILFTRLDPVWWVTRDPRWLNRFELGIVLLVFRGIGAWFSAVRTALEAEMTRNVLAARELRNERGAWPSELPGLESSVCPGARWDYSTSPNGWMSLSIRSNPSLGDPIVFHAGVR
jgi:hypothetical protein